MTATLQDIMDEVKSAYDIFNTHAGNTNAAIKALEQDILDIKRGSLEGGGPAQHPSMTGAQRQEFNAAIRKALRSGATTDVFAAMQTGSDPDGGYSVNPHFSREVTTRVYDQSPVRRLARVVSAQSGTFEEVVDKSDFSAAWVAETASRPATATPQLGKLSIAAHEAYAFPLITQQLLDDSSFDLLSWLSGKAADYFARQEGAAFVTGDGVGKPRGFTTYTTAATGDASREWGQLEHVVTGTNGSFGSAPNGSDKLIDLQHKLKIQHRANASWLMNRATAGAVRKLKADDKYIWLPSMEAGQPDRLLGHPVELCEDMPDYTTTGALAIAFGDFRAGYTVVDRLGVRSLTDPYTQKPYVGLYIYRRVGGAVANFDAIKFLKFST